MIQARSQLLNKIISLLIATLLLSSCGFHLRGAIDIPNWLNHVAIISNNSDKQLTQSLQAQLEGYKVQVSDDPSQAKYWIIISSSKISQHIISIGASTNPRQYQLILTIGFLLQTREGQVIKPLRHIAVTRQITVNNNRILGSNEEEEVLLSEMRQDAIIQIINRLTH